MSFTRITSSSRVSIILDASESAISCWAETRHAALDIITRFEQGRVLDLYLLGSGERPSENFLEPLQPPLVNGKVPQSFVGPVLERVIKEHPLSSVILIGNGVVFDLDDWLGDPFLESWLLIRSGQELLHGDIQNVQQITVNDITRLTNLFDRFQSFSLPTVSQSQRIFTHGYQWRIDKTGYPLLWIEPLQSYVSLFPVTKPQFERYLAAALPAGCNDEWYAEIMKGNPRLSFRSNDQSRYEGLFLTGLTVAEAPLFGDWLDDNARLLSVDEWHTCYRWLGQQPVTSSTADLHALLSRDARAIWKIIESECKPTTMQELSLFRGGVMEWVIDISKNAIGLGDPRLNSGFSRRLRQVFDVVKPIVSRPRDFGLRFIIAPYKRRI
jgi:hypothetical protein